MSDIKQPTDNAVQNTPKKRVNQHVAKYQRYAPGNADTGRDQLLFDHMPLVQRIAYHLLARLHDSVQIDDLLQAGVVGLIEASQNFDPTKGASFETFAGIRIRGAMLDEVRRGDWAPRSVHRNARRIAQAINQCEKHLGRDGRSEEIAAVLGVSMDEYQSMLADVSHSKLLGFEEIGIDFDQIIFGDKHQDSPEHMATHESFKNALEVAIESLPPREKQVFSLYYLEEFNLKEIGVTLNVSESRVCQIHSQAMLRLRNKLIAWVQG